MGRQALTSKESELPMIFRSDWGNLALQELWVQQHREYRGLTEKNIKKTTRKNEQPKKQTRKPKPRKKTRKTKKNCGKCRFCFCFFLIFVFFLCFFLLFLFLLVILPVDLFFWWFGFLLFFFLLKSTFSVLHGVIMQESGKNWIEISEQERRCFGLRIFFGIGSV